MIVFEKKEGFSFKLEYDEVERVFECGMFFKRLKKKIPPSDRFYFPKERRWWVSDNYKDFVIGLYREYFPELWGVMNR